MPIEQATEIVDLLTMIMFLAAIRTSLAISNTITKETD